MRLHRRRQRGSHAVEFALTAPLFIYLLFALMDYSWYHVHRALAEYITMRGCREGAFYHPDDPSVPPNTAAELAIYAGIEQWWPNCRALSSCDVVTEVGLQGPYQAVSCDVTVQMSPLSGLIVQLPDEIRVRTVMLLEVQE